jgi:hypothetical protein
MCEELSTKCTINCVNRNLDVIWQFFKRQSQTFLLDSLVLYTEGKQVVGRKVDLPKYDRTASLSKMPSVLTNRLLTQLARSTENITQCIVLYRSFIIL